MIVVVYGTYKSLNINSSSLFRERNLFFLCFKCIYVQSLLHCFFCVSSVLVLEMHPRNNEVKAFDCFFSFDNSSTNFNTPLVPFVGVDTWTHAKDD